MYMRRIVFFIFLFSLLDTIASSQHLKVETWYDDKKTILKESFYVLKSNSKILDSTYTSYYHSGKIKSTGNYLKNKGQGLWEYFYENGNIKMRGNLKDNSAIGKWEYFYENTGLNMEGTIEKGMKEGEWKFYYENGNSKSLGEYRKNQKEGIWKYFNEDGSYKAQAIFQKDNGMYTEYYPSGAIKSEGEITSGKSSGIWKYYHENGNLKAEGEEKDGLREGLWKFYYDNGVLASEGNYLKGKEEGKWKYYHENSKLSAEGENVEGQKEGYWKLYYKDGAFKAEGNFKKGDGLYKEYYESGKLKIEGYVKQEKNDGEWKYFYESGALEGKCFFIEGKGHYTGYYENKKLKMEGAIEDGKKVGTWKLYNENGQLAGYYKTYYEDDVPVFVPIEEVATDSVKVDSIKPIEKPQVKLPKKRSRHYTSKVNEYKDFIIAAQPAGLLRNQFPISLEYYYQERLGLEINYTFLRNPFFGAAPTMSLAEYHRGFSAYFRQKLYQRDQDKGMFYWGQELRFSSIDHFVIHKDTNTEVTSRYQSNEKLYEFSFLFGDRILKDSRKKGWTIDIFTGLGGGYRKITRNYPSAPSIDRLFTYLNTKNYSIRFRFGFSVGYLF